MNKKFFLLLSMALAASTSTMCAKIVEDITDEATDEALAGKKARFNFPAGDTVFSFGGDLREEYRLALNPTFLNNDLPDDYQFFRNTFELKTNFAWGQKKYGHKAVEMLATLRHKGNWGGQESSARSTSASLKFDKASLGDHSHGNNYPLVWIKELWANISLNAAFNVNSDLIQSLKIGMLPFALGRGIALGYAYGLNKGFLGVYSAQSDHCAPGILLSGELIKNTLSYDVYVATLESNSGSTKQTLSPSKANQIGKKATPFSGSFTDDILFATQVHLKNEFSGLSTEVSPYVMYNAGRNKKVEVPADSESYLTTVGCNLECEKDGFEFGGECALNMGYQDVYSIDRNTVSLVNDTGYPIMAHSHIYSGNANQPYGYTSKNLAGADHAVNTAVLKNNASPVNGETFTYTVLAADQPSAYTNGTMLTFQNATDRVRPYYRNKYAGYMAVADVAYTFKKVGLKLAAAVGKSSGDVNPNDSEQSTTYKGFVSLNEVYSGNQVQSVMILGNRDNKRPLSLTGGVTKAPAEDNSFSDIIFTGVSATIKPPAIKSLTINPNLMAFWKDHQSAAWDAATNKPSLTEIAGSFMGIEFNTKFSYEIFEDTKLFGSAACFIPGQYYKDIAGAVLSDDIVKKLEIADTTGLDATNYRIAYDKSYYFNLGINFVF